MPQIATWEKLGQQESSPILVPLFALSLPLFPWEQLPDCLSSQGSRKIRFGFKGANAQKNVFQIA
jgi:hypothetical protein